ncbi:MAG: 50S ribosomal protein L15 [Lentisphaerae bacterium]|nr:50S ribosomal protein L15 [Lentisphaerota bacterium]
MKLHELKMTPGARVARRRVGRGESSGMGKTSGRGHKGQMARKGHKHKAGFEGGQMPLLRRLPKRGFTNHSRRVWAPVNVGVLAEFADGAEVSAASLREAGLVRGRWDGIKILGEGEISRKLTVKAQAFSATAKAKIEAVGGTCQVVTD